MKAFRKLFVGSLLLFGLVAFSQITIAQAPPPPPAEKGTNTNKAPGGGAPIEGGVYVALALVAAFGTWKLVKVAYNRSQVADNQCLFF